MPYKNQRREVTNIFRTHQTYSQNLFYLFSLSFSYTPVRCCFNREMQYKARPNFHPQRTLVREDGKLGRNAVMRSLLRQHPPIQELLTCNPSHEYS